ENEKEWTDGIPSKKEEVAYNHVHEVLKILLRVIPMSCDILVQSISKCFPFHGRPAHEQECYIHNILKITVYQPYLRYQILFFILKRLVSLDVNAPRSEVMEQEDDVIEDMDLDEAETMFNMETSDIKDSTEDQFKMKHPVANCLDVAMRQIFIFIKSQCYNSVNQINWDRTKSLYYDIIKVFDEVILTTYATYHIQFLIFYLCSFKMQLVEGFLSFLWRKVINPNVAPVIRQSAVMYVGSLLSRSSYINIKLVSLDVNAPRSEVMEQEDDVIEDMDLDEAETMFNMETSDIKDSTEDQFKMKHPVANCLDVAMRQIFIFIKSQCYNSVNQINWDRTKSLYYDIIKVFDEVILTTYATYHIQFLIFYLCSFKMQLVEGFLSFLWRKVINPNVAPVIRQSAVMYVGSLLSRSSYININMIKTSLAEMSIWIHKYIESQDGLESANSDVRVHAVFYSVCQSLFYIVAFRYRDLVSGKKNLTFLQNLNLTKIVTCKLNPLKVCLPVVVQNFAAVTRTYQLAYCYAVMEHNARNTLPVVHQDFKGGFHAKDTYWLETFFPFDPFVLVR
ncbi:hypothetical protein C0J52_27788, partial [Blattella germanica]